MTRYPGPLSGHRISLPPAPGTVRRRTLRHRVWGAGAALLGAAMFLIGALLLTEVPGLTEDEKAFGAATPCTARAGARDDCLRSFEATVTRTVIREQPKSYEYTLYLKGPKPVPRSIDMGGSGPLLKRLSPGDVVTVTLWRDYAAEVRRGEVSQQSADTPEGEAVFASALALAFLSGGAYGVYAGGTALSKARQHAVKGLPATLLTCGRWAGGAALCAIPAMIVGFHTSVPVMLVVWLGLLPLVRWVVRQLQQPGTGRDARPHAYPVR